MSIRLTKLSELTPDEREDVKAYYADATYFHACSQGWGGEFNDSKRFGAFKGECGKIQGLIDSAIGKFEVEREGVVYFGNGGGSSSIGCLDGEPQRFIGMSYRYPGYTSTSIHRDHAENFLRTGSSGSIRPVLLQIALLTGQGALPVDQATGQAGEGEVLLPRGLAFKVMKASMIRIHGVNADVLFLELSQ